VLLAALKVPEILGKAIGYWQPAWSPILATFNVARGLMAASGQGAARP
jgi:arabinogalactan endo-1,4-beta-galactosidase